MSWEGLIGTLALGSVVTGHVPIADRPLKIEVTLDSANKCKIRFEGRYITSPELKQILRAEQDKAREVHVAANAKTPYRCVGGAIYLVQSEEFSRIGFISLPEE